MEILIGFAIAVVIALTGVGAGVVTAPLLILFLHLPVEIAVTIALAYSALVKLIIVPIQMARGLVNYRILGYMLLGGLPGVIEPSRSTWGYDTKFGTPAAPVGPSRSTIEPNIEASALRSAR